MDSAEKVRARVRLSFFFYLFFFLRSARVGFILFQWSPAYYLQNYNNIYIFKNYFIIIFLIFNNKLYLNGHSVVRAFPFIRFPLTHHSH